jgi:toxin ParE1/3/4
MAKFNLSNKAVDDLAQIWNYTVDTWSENQADNYYQMLIDTCSEIANNPDSGKYYDKIVGGLCGHKAGRHIVFYIKVNSNEIDVFRVFHEQMDLPSRLKNEKPT